MDVSGETGDEVVLTCLADANPTPSYKWFRNGNLDLVIIKFAQKYYAFLYQGKASITDLQI